MSVLEVDGLAKAFAGRTIFEAVSLRVEPGSATAITGPSGTGKTTLLRCLNGLELADRGSVGVGEARIVGGAPHQEQQLAIRALRSRVGFVFQASHLFSHRTALQNVMEGPLYVKREAPEAARTRAEALLEKVGVHHRARRQSITRL